MKYSFKNPAEYETVDEIDARLRELRDRIRERDRQAMDEAYRLLGRRSTLRADPAIFLNGPAEATR